MSRIITLSDIKLKEVLITREPSLVINLLFQRLDDTGAVHDMKRVILSEDDFTSAQMTKFTEIMAAIKSKALNKEGI